jgi:hypothetical protein
LLASSSLIRARASVAEQASVPRCPRRTCTRGRRAARRALGVARASGTPSLGRVDGRCGATTRCCGLRRSRSASPAPMPGEPAEVSGSSHRPWPAGFYHGRQPGGRARLRNIPREPAGRPEPDPLHLALQVLRRHEPNSRESHEIVPDCRRATKYDAPRARRAPFIVARSRARAGKAPRRARRPVLTHVASLERGPRSPGSPTLPLGRSPEVGIGRIAQDHGRR